ncbi:MAG: hypothetical protein K2Q04_17970 [Hyphomicrobium sp.]|nr:hypothetical protein [Hyphomicrobium sp.]
MHRLSASFVLGYHGCDKDTAEALLAGEAFKPSDNLYDWLGPGIYFWQSNPDRALAFANEKKRRAKGSWDEAVVGAVIDMGLCLDLTTAAGAAELRSAHGALTQILQQSEGEYPVNEPGRPKLDCAVIRSLHDIRKNSDQPSIDTVLGIFFEGQPIYPNSYFYEKTHVQICVCNPSQIKGVFRVGRPNNGSLV